MKLKTVPRPREISQDDILVNTAFMTALTLELMIREIERRLKMHNAAFQREAKKKFSYFTDHCKKALFYAEELTQEIYKVDAAANWRNIPVWQEESNELARLILLYADRSSDIDNVEAIFKMIRERPGEGLVDEKMLEKFYLKKNH